MAFEPNTGQADPEIRWISRTPERTFLLTRDEARMLLQKDGSVAAIRMKLIGAKASEGNGLDPLPSTSSYFVGTNAAEWRSGVPHYGCVRYSDVYKGVDVVYYSSERQLEYDFIVAPGADPSKIQLAYEGAESIRVDKDGALILNVNGRTVRQLRPKVYQKDNGRRREIAASYRLLAGNRVKFTLGDYDRSRELVIDPVVQYSTYFGNEGYEAGAAITSDRNGDVYVTGVTTSVRYSTTAMAQEVFGGDSDAFVAKLSGSTGALIWVTYLGGAKTDSGYDIAVDAAGNAYVVGNTLSTNFPVRNAVYGQSAGDYDGFLAKVSSDGRQFLFSTYLGGSSYDQPIGVAVDGAGDAYVTGLTTSFDFPVRNGFQTGGAGGGGDIFVSKFSTTRNSLVYSTYVGGDGLETATGIAVDADGNAYVTGGTTSTIFPVFAPIQTASGGDRDAFIFKLNPSGTSLVYATFLGGSAEDFGYRIALDAQRAAYVLGYTKSTNFPTRGAAQASNAGLFDAFVTKVNPAGSAIEYSTYLGGSGDDFGFGDIVVDGGGSAYVSGYTSSTNFPARSQFQLGYGGGQYDAFLARLAPQGNSLVYSSLLGGSGDDFAYGLAVDAQGQPILAGKTSSANFPSVSNAFVGDARGGFDIFVSRISSDASINFVTPTAGSLTFAVRPGVPTAAQTVTLSSGSGSLNVTAQSDQAWLRVNVDRSSTPATLTVTIDSATLPTTSTASGVITVNAPLAANSPLVIPVTVNQVVAPTITGASPNSLTRDAANAIVTLTGTGFQNGLSVRVNNTTVPSTFVNGTTLQVTVPGALRANANSLQFVVFSAEGTQSNSFTVTLGSDATGVVVLPAGIVNAASNQADVIAPGEILLVYGTGFGPAQMANGTLVNGALATSAGGVRVLFDDLPAPVLYAKQNQVAVIVPYGVAGRSSVAMQLEWEGQRTTPIRLTVGGAAPGLFTADSSGTGQASAINQDGTPNSASNPAPAGSVVSLYATGEGLLSPPGAEGRIVTTERPVLPVNVLINGIPVTPEFAGGSPGSFVGLLQVNVRIPAGVSGIVPVQLQVGGVQSRTGVTIAVR
ncbi:MAG TPA: SBBP repeat-containing protein [Bryobacteraceae bacterium]|nr:SBBP repeat-containing protein [Bryobacteraceae bacterium]